MNRRTFIKGLAAAGVLTGAATGLGALKPKVFNSCRPAIPVSLLDSPWVQSAWQGIDPAGLWDCHVHLAGLGDTDSGIQIGPQMDSWLHPLQYARRIFFMNASCAGNSPGRVDTAFVTRLLNLCDAMPKGFKAMLFAFDYYHDDAGQPHPEHSSFYIPGSWARRLASEFPERFEWVASLHPYAPGAADTLTQSIAQGAKAVKWLPAAQGMDPASPRCDAFYEVLARTATPLIVHCGEENAVKGSDTQAFGNPLRMRRALDAGVTVVVAHCATLGIDQDDKGQLRPSFDLFLELMEEPRAQQLLYGDISAITQRNRKPEQIATLLKRTDLHDRLLHGSDYPLPAVVPLTSPAQLAKAGLLPKDAIPELLMLREHNALLFDFVLKRLLEWQGQRFSASVFNTRRLFDRPR